MTRCRCDRGSVLVLFPTAVVVVLLLGTLTLDAAAVFLRQREVYNVAASAANDAAGVALDADRARRTGDYLLHPDRARAVAAASVEASTVPGIELVAVVTGDQQVTVTVRAPVPRAMVPILGHIGPDVIEMTASARATSDGDGTLGFAGPQP